MSDERRARHVIRGWDGITAYSGFGRTQLQAMIAGGHFPAPLKLGPRAVGWWESDVRDWQDELAAKQATGGAKVIAGSND